MVKLEMAKERSTPHVTVGKRIQRPGKLGFGQGFHRRLGQTEVFSRGDFEIDPRSTDDHHGFAQTLYQLSVVSHLLVSPVSVCLDEQLSAKRLWGLGFPNARPGNRFFHSFAVTAFQGSIHRHSQNRRSRFFGCSKNIVDPLVANARSSCVVNRHEPGFWLDLRQGVRY